MKAPTKYSLLRLALALVLYAMYVETLFYGVTSYYAPHNLRWCAFLFVACVIFSFLFFKVFPKQVRGVHYV